MNGSQPSLELALLDPSYRTPEMSYWTWVGPGLTRPLLDRIYYQWLTESAMAKLEHASGTRPWGGVICVDETTICWFRFLDGGRDTLGRPGRLVLLCALGHRRACSGCSRILVGSGFTRVATDARTSIPVPAPAAFCILQEDLEAPTAKKEVTKVSDLTLQDALGSLNTLVGDTAVAQSIMYIVQPTGSATFRITRIANPSLERNEDPPASPDERERIAAAVTKSDRPTIQDTRRANQSLLAFLVGAAVIVTVIIGSGWSPQKRTQPTDSPKTLPTETQKVPAPPSSRPGPTIPIDPPSNPEPPQVPSQSRRR